MTSYIQSPAIRTGYSPDSFYKPTDTFYSKQDIPYSLQCMKSPWSSYAQRAAGHNSDSHFVHSINPRVTILPPQPSSSDLDTPSSSSSYSLPTPSSPFRNPIDEDADMDMDEFEYDEDEDEDLDSDFTEEMDGVDDAAVAGHSPPYSMAVPHIIKSTSALEGALGNYSRGELQPRGIYQPSQPIGSDRKMSASAPGQRTFGTHVHRHDSDESASFPHESRLQSPNVYPHQNTIYTHSTANSSSTLFAPTPYSIQSSSSSSSLAAAIPREVLPVTTRPSTTRLTIYQPQPIRPIPPIPLTDLTSSAAEEERSVVFRDTRQAPQQPQGLSPLSLLCQPVSDAVRYQLKTTADENQLYDEQEAGSNSDEGETSFIHEQPTYFHDSSAAGSYSAEKHTYSSGYMGIGNQF
ncbi:hypothetical protein BJ138DRAFT_1097656 [Hygrophoropsis aurantiaca]|uniref:Uncharacterized protein n=1 Tax=Hygrophoropsis aurantiaca TaxID=72124 RepID=A0ACB8AS02_9AGAM|nr:hypothetical protein BJ138DRAFT_1097656 [Hygrophoropsis aurantiaca]